MRVRELIVFIKERVPGTYYPNSFPVSDKAPDNCAVVKLTGGFPPSQWTGKKQPSFQIRVRGERDPKRQSEADAETEDRAYEIHGALTNLRNVKIGNNSVVLIRSMNSNPLHIGEDENNRPIYSMNFDCVVRP